MTMCTTGPIFHPLRSAGAALLRWLNYSQNAHRVRDSGHNHQGVNSLADRKSLLKQTGELAY